MVKPRFSLINSQKFFPLLYTLNWHRFPWGKNKFAVKRGFVIMPWGIEKYDHLLRKVKAGG
jgi:hypothetical protein